MKKRKAGCSSHTFNASPGKEEMGRFLKLSAQASSPNHVAPGKQKTNKNLSPDNSNKNSQMIKQTHVNGAGRWIPKLIPHHSYAHISTWTQKSQESLSLGGMEWWSCRTHKLFSQSTASWYISAWNQLWFFFSVLKAKWSISVDSIPICLFKTLKKKVMTLSLSIANAWQKPISPGSVLKRNTATVALKCGDTERSRAKHGSE